MKWKPLMTELLRRLRSAQPCRSAAAVVLLLAAAVQEVRGQGAEDAMPPNFSEATAARQSAPTPPPPPATVADLVSELKAPTAARRLKAVRELLKRAVPDAKLKTVGPLGELLGDARPEVRLEAAQLLRRIGGSSVESIAALSVRLHKGDHGGEGVARLFILASEASIESLGHAVAHDRVRVRRSAIGALGQLGEQADPVIEYLERALDDEAVAPLAVQALGEIAGPIGVDALIQVLRRPNSKLQIAAAEALGGIGADAKRALPALVRSSEERDPQVALAAQQAIGKIRTALRRR